MDGGVGGTAIGDFGGEFVHLIRAVRRYIGRPERDFNLVELASQVQLLGRCIDVLRLEQAQLVGVLAKAGYAQDQGCGSAVEWLRHDGMLSSADAAEVVVVGEHLDRLPKAREALHAGLLGFGHLVHMARNAAFSDRHQKGSFDEAPLVARAKNESVGRFRFTCLSLRHAQDPQGVVDAEVAAVEGREVNFNPMDDGTTYINLLLDTPTARIIELDTRRRAERLGPDDTRSFARRQADAMIDRLLGDGDMSVDITLSGTPDTFMGLAGAPAAELEHCDPVSGEMFRRLGCSASFTKILLDDRLIPVAATTSRRMPTAKERKALDVKQKHCQGRGCHRPARECIPHHLQWYARTHETQLDRLLLLCPYHHWMVHERGWVVAVTGDGKVLWIPPVARAPSLADAA